jgi:hypothetical protein
VAKSSTETLLFRRANARTDIELPTVIAPRTLNLSLNCVISPIADRPEPILLHALRESDEPNEVKLSVENPSPPRAKLRTLIDDPNCAKLITDILRVEPVTARPMHLHVEPARAKVRTDKLEPIAAKLRADNIPPISDLRRSETVLARRKKSNTLTFFPHLDAARTLKDEPRDAESKTLTVVEDRMKDRILRELPK